MDDEDIQPLVCDNGSGMVKEGFAGKDAPRATPFQPSGGGSMLSGIDSTIAPGFTFGTRSAIAHIFVDVVVGPRTVKHEYAPAKTPDAQTGSLSIANMGGMDSCTNQAKAF